MAKAKSIPSWALSTYEEIASLQKEQKKKYRPEFWVTEDTQARILFLSDKAIPAPVHRVKMGSRYRYITCPKKGQGCPLCATHATKVVMVYIINELPRVVTNSNGERVKLKYQQKYLIAGPNVERSLQLLIKAGRLLNKVIEVSRSGTGLSTTYSYLPIGKPSSKIIEEIKTLGLDRCTLDVNADFGPPSSEELRSLADAFSGGDTLSDAPWSEPTSGARKDYLADSDDDDDMIEDDDDDVYDDDAYDGEDGDEEVA